VTDAVTDLRELSVIPWGWFTDEERALHGWDAAATVAEGLAGELPQIRITPWSEGLPPLVLCESNATASVLRPTVYEYVCRVAGTKGQTRGFLETVVAPILTDEEGRVRRVLYLGDLDRSGNDIEENTRRVLERAIGRALDWLRLGMTQEQAEERGITPIWKVDGRDCKGHWAIEVESLGQGRVVRLVRDALDSLLPEPHFGSCASARRRSGPSGSTS
jgi:hypothetical protein